MRTEIATVVPVVVNVFLLSRPAYTQPMFMALGDPQRRDFDNWSLGVSGDASTVVGATYGCFRRCLHRGGVLSLHIHTLGRARMQIPPRTPANR